MRIRLGDADRERYGLDEWTPFDATRCTVREAALLQSIGYNTPYDWQEAITGPPVIEGGKPVYIRDDSGDIVRDDNGDPVPARRRDFIAWAALIWLMLRRNGSTIEFADVDFDLRAFRWEADPEPDPGKALDTPETISDSSETATHPT